MSLLDIVRTPFYFFVVVCPVHTFLYVSVLLSFLFVSVFLSFLFVSAFLSFLSAPLMCRVYIGRSALLTILYTDDDGCMAIKTFAYLIHIWPVKQRIFTIIIRNIFPWNGPAKSTCTLLQGVSGHSQGCRGAAGGAACKVRHTVHVFARLSMSWSNPLHQK